MTLDWSVKGLVARGEVDESWADALTRVEPTLLSIAVQLSSDPFLPAAPQVFRALRTPLSQVRVLLLGQDPYPTPGYAMGLAFSVSPDVRPVPGSLRNIFRELADDLGAEAPATGDLSPWVTQGVLLLNRTLTVSPGDPMSHRKLSWSAVIDSVIEQLVDRAEPLVAMVWGREAQSAVEPLRAYPFVRIVESAHPSPLSASRGFFGSRPFSRANAALAELGASPIEWSLVSTQEGASCSNPST